MTISRKLAVSVSGAAACVTAGALFFSAGAASAATPPYEPDPSSVGTITFYNASGAVITSGSSTTAPFAAYAVGSVAPRAGDPQAQLIFANPDPGTTPPFYYKEQVGSYTQLPLTTGPSNIQTASKTKPVVAGGARDQTPQGFEDDALPSTASGYAGNIQVRLRTATAASAGGSPSTTYDVADIHLNGDGTWTQVYPTPQTATTTTVTATPSPATVGQSVTLSATETPAVAGSVQFQDGTTNIGSPVAVDGTGKASTTTSTLTQGSHTINAVFTPTDAANAGSTGTTSLTVNPAATPTTTTLAVTQDGTAGDPASLSATVTGPGTTPNTAGTVSFYDNNSTTPLNPSPVTSTDGTYKYALPNGFGAGAHSVVAKFTPTNVANFTASQSVAQSFTTAGAQTGPCDPAGGGSCTDQQNVQVTVPSGTLTITTPYTAANPLDLGTMTLATNSTQFTASAPFQNIAVTDTRAGTNGYTVSALALPLNGQGSAAGSSINSENVGLTGLTSVKGSGFAGTVTTTDNAAASPAVASSDTGSKGLGGPAPHTVFTVTNGLGTVTVNGTLTINAPTSTKAGLYTGTITFTVG